MRRRARDRTGAFGWGRGAGTRTGGAMRGHEEVELGGVGRDPGPEAVQEGEGQDPGEGKAQEVHGLPRARGREGRPNRHARREARGHEDEDEGEVREATEAAAEGGPEEEAGLVRREREGAGPGQPRRER